MVDLGKQSDSRMDTRNEDRLDEHNIRLSRLEDIFGRIGVEVRDHQGEIKAVCKRLADVELNAATRQVTAAHIIELLDESRTTIKDLSAMVQSVAMRMDESAGSWKKQIILAVGAVAIAIIAIVWQRITS